MIESLWRWVPGVEVTVLCLDDQLEPILREWAGDRVATVTTETLVAREPRLGALRAERAAWEYYATQKPLFLAHLCEALPEGELIAFADADTWFFASPEPLFDQMRDASIGLSPHRFHASMLRLEPYGRFNAGFGLWRNDSNGRRCLQEWSRDCLEWCHCRVEGLRFMNQGYLTQWPDRYEGITVLNHPGENLGPWNIEAHQLGLGSDGVTVDGRPLIFFHFSSIFRGSDGGWKIHDLWPGLRRRFVLRHIFAPYLDEVDKAGARICQRYGDVAKGSVRYPDPTKPTLDLRDWQAAPEAGEE